MFSSFPCDFKMSFIKLLKKRFSILYLLNFLIILVLVIELEWYFCSTAWPFHDWKTDWKNDSPHKIHLQKFQKLTNGETIRDTYDICDVYYVCRVYCIRKFALIISPVQNRNKIKILEHLIHFRETVTESFSFDGEFSVWLKWV